MFGLAYLPQPYPAAQPFGRITMIIREKLKLTEKLQTVRGLIINKRTVLTFELETPAGSVKLEIESPHDTDAQVGDEFCLELTRST